MSISLDDSSKFPVDSIYFFRAVHPAKPRLLKKGPDPDIFFADRIHHRSNWRMHISTPHAADTVSPGKFATYTVTITPVSGFSGTLAMSCAVVPAAPKTTCTVPNQVAVNGGPQVFLSVSAKNSTKGTYNITFTGVFTATPPATGSLSETSNAVSLKVK